MGFFTSATGVTIYRGNAYADSFRGNVFIGDVGGNLVHRKTLTPDGVSFVAKRADEGAEFLTSTDTWFRPVNFVNGPDGCLYILDMYRETIEHPASIPEDIKAHLDLESGHDRGRIWRLTPPDWRNARPPRLDELSVVELAGQLASSNVWRRETAQRLLRERRDEWPADGLRSLLPDTLPPEGRVQVLWLHQCCGELRAEDLEAAGRDASPAVRRQAVRLTAEMLPRVANEEQHRLESLLKLRAVDNDAGVQFQVALSLAACPEEVASAIVSELVHRESLDRDVRTALLLSIRGRGVRVAASLLEDAGPVSATTREFLDELLQGIGTRGSDDEARQLLVGDCDPLRIRRDAREADGAGDRSASSRDVVAGSARRGRDFGRRGAACRGVGVRQAAADGTR